MTHFFQSLTNQNSSLFRKFGSTPTKKLKNKNDAGCFICFFMNRDPEVPQGEQEEKGIRYKVEVYEKIE